MVRIKNKVTQSRRWKIKQRRTLLWTHKPNDSTSFQGISRHKNQDVLSVSLGNNKTQPHNSPVTINYVNFVEKWKTAFEFAPARQQQLTQVAKLFRISHSLEAIAIISTSSVSKC